MYPQKRSEPDTLPLARLCRRNESWRLVFLSLDFIFVLPTETGWLIISF